MKQTFKHSEQASAYYVLLKENVIENEDFDFNIDYVRMLKEFNGYSTMYGQSELKY